MKSSSLRDDHSSFGLDPSEEYLVGCRIEPLPDAIEWGIERSSGICGDWTVRAVIMKVCSKREEYTCTYMRALYASITMLCLAAYSRIGDCCA